MLNIQKILIILLIFVLSSCSVTTIPKVNLDNIKVKEKMNLKAALIVSDELKKFTHLTTVNGKCVEEKTERTKTGSIYAKNEVGKSVEEIIIKGLPYLFNDINVYGDLNEIKDKAAYDLILVPEISADTWYDDKKAANRKILASSPGDLINLKAWAERSCFKISASVELNLKIITAKNGELIANLSSPFTVHSTACSSWCSNSSTDIMNSLTSEYSDSFSLAINNAFPKLLQRVEFEVTSLAKAKSEEKALPSSLAMNVKFSDAVSLFPNNTLDAGEEAEISITVRNDGKGSGYGTLLQLSSDNPKVSFDKELPLGDIAPGETKDIKVRVKAGLDLADGSVPFNITCTEKRGYNCKNYKLEVQSAKLEKPELSLTGYKLNDGNTGLASGNGNGIPENGETIEIIPLVKNSGAGEAINVELSIASSNSGLDIKTKDTTIKRITPGQTASGNLAFAIPATFSDRAINLTLSATDVRGASAAATSKQFALNTEINKPMLAYTYRILDSKGNVRNEVQNGEYAEIELKPINKGQLEARNVIIELSSSTADFTKKRDEIARLGAQVEYSPVRFPFQIPRVTEKNSVDVAVRLEQRDFAGLSDTINIPIKLVKPDFKVTYQLLDQNSNGILEQGETADLLVRVENTGQLDAEGVALHIEIRQKGISIIGSKEAGIGRLEAGKASEQKRFSIAVQRAAEPGQAPLDFTVSEKTFGNKNITLAMNIAKEQEEVIVVKGQERTKQQAAAAPVYYSSRPVIAMAMPRDNERTASESLTVNGVATAEKGIAHVELQINGRRIDNAGRGVKVRAKETGAQKEKDFLFENIPLQAGENKIIVTAYDNENQSSSKTLTVYRESKKGEIYAAVIGINKYSDSKLNLKYARDDAKAFADYMKMNMGLDKDHVFELYDEQATTRGIKALLGQKLRQKASKPEDTVFVFFAGHGAPDKDNSVIDDDKIRKYILTYDSDIENLYSSAFPMDEIAGIFSNISADRVIFIIDSCYSGAGGGRTILAQQSRSVLSEDFLNRISQGKGRIILTSSKPGEISKESDELKHGFFTYYLLEGLKGKADKNSDGIIDLDEISLYLNEIVPRETKGDQHPVKKGVSEGQVVVGRVK